MSSGIARLRFQFARARHRVSIRVRAWRASDEFVCLMALATPRTGSYLLLDYLRWIPGVSMTDEVLNHRRVVGVRASAQTARKVAHVRRSVRALGGPIRGAKIMLYPDHPDALDVLCADESSDMRFVVLFRRDLIAQFVSHEQAKRSGTWTTTTPSGRPAEVAHLDESRARAYGESLRISYERCAELLRGRPVVYVAYEDLIEDPVRALGPVADMVGASLTRVESPLRKQGTRPLEERVDDRVVLERLRAAGLARFDPTRADGREP